MHKNVSDIRLKANGRGESCNSEDSKALRQSEESINSQSCEENGAKVKIEPDFHAIDGQTTQPGTTKASVMKSPNDSKQASNSELGNSHKNANSKNSDK